MNMAGTYRSTTDWWYARWMVGKIGRWMIMIGDLRESVRHVATSLEELTFGRDWKSWKNDSSMTKPFSSKFSPSKIISSWSSRKSWDQVTTILSAWRYTFRSYHSKVFWCVGHMMLALMAKTRGFAFFVSKYDGRWECSVIQTWRQNHGHSHSLALFARCFLRCLSFRANAGVPRGYLCCHVMWLFPRDGTFAQMISLN